MDLLVGTFNKPFLYWLRFDPGRKTLVIRSVSKAIGGHSWLSLSTDQQYLYCTAWTKPEPSVAAYEVENSSKKLKFLNNESVPNRPGYVCCSETHLYSVGGAAGQVFSLRDDGGIGDLIQEMDFNDMQRENMSEKRGAVAHGDFGGLRHGAHSCDLSPDGETLYVADIGRNCIWAYDTKGLRTTGSGLGEGTLPAATLSLRHKEIAPRSNDGPRHSWPHPNGQMLYSVQEHSNMVDVFRIEKGPNGEITKLSHNGGVSILPSDKDASDFWADEVRLSTGPDAANPEFLYASTRGLKSETQGYVSVFRLNKDGSFQSETAIDIWMTPTSGGIANAIEPAPWSNATGSDQSCQYLALTDSHEGTVMILSFDGEKIRQVSVLKLSCPPTLDSDTEIVGSVQVADGEDASGDGVVEAATAVWLR